MALTTHEKAMIDAAWNTGQLTEKNWGMFLERLRNEPDRKNAVQNALDMSGGRKWIRGLEKRRDILDDPGKMGRLGQEFVEEHGGYGGAALEIGKQTITSIPSIIGSAAKVATFQDLGEDPLGEVISAAQIIPYGRMAAGLGRAGAQAAGRGVLAARLAHGATHPAVVNASRASEVADVVGSENPLVELAGEGAFEVGSTAIGHGFQGRRERRAADKMLEGKRQLGNISEVHPDTGAEVGGKRDREKSRRRRAYTFEQNGVQGRVDVERTGTGNKQWKVGVTFGDSTTTAEFDKTEGIHSWETAFDSGLTQFVQEHPDLFPSEEVTPDETVEETVETTPDTTETPGAETTGADTESETAPEVSQTPATETVVETPTEPEETAPVPPQVDMPDDLTDLAADEQMARLFESRETLMAWINENLDGEPTPELLAIEEQIGNRMDELEGALNEQEQAREAAEETEQAAPADLESLAAEFVSTTGQNYPTRISLSESLRFDELVDTFLTEQGVTLSTEQRNAFKEATLNAIDAKGATDAEGTLTQEQATSLMDRYAEEALEKARQIYRLLKDLRKYQGVDLGIDAILKEDVRDAVNLLKPGDPRREFDFREVYADARTRAQMLGEQFGADTSDEGVAETLRVNAEKDRVAEALGIPRDQFNDRVNEVALEKLNQQREASRNDASGDEVETPEAGGQTPDTPDDGAGGSDPDLTETDLATPTDGEGGEVDGEETIDETPTEGTPETARTPTDSPAAAAASGEPAPISAEAPTPEGRLAFEMLERLRRGEKTTIEEFYELADAAWGGTRSEGTYSEPEAYNVMEVAGNLFILEQMQENREGDGIAVTTDAAKSQAAAIRDFVEQNLPRQDMRDPERDEFQQYSTPFSYGYALNWVADVRSDDVVLEPSAGTGNIAIYGKVVDAQVVVNELADRRAKLLEMMGFDPVFRHNAEQIDNLLPPEIKPTVVVMNPPFSASAGRLSDNDNEIGGNHVLHALRRLEPGGRLVAIVGGGINPEGRQKGGMRTDSKGYRKFWEEAHERASLRANIHVDGAVYSRFGTPFDTRVLVFDKPVEGETASKEGWLDRNVTSVEELIDALEEVRNARQRTTPPQGGRPGEPDTRGEPTRRTPPERATGTGRSTGDLAGGAEGADVSGSGSGRIPPPDRAVGGGGDTTTGASDEAVDTETDDELSPDTPGQPGGLDQPDTPPEEGGEPAASDTPTGGNVTDTTGGRPRPTAGSESPAESDTETVVEEDAEAIFRVHQPSAETMPENAKPHREELDEPLVMADVPLPPATYTPDLPPEAIESGMISDAQMLPIIYAGQAFEQFFETPTGRVRAGFFDGDGTGVGKSHSIAGIIADNFRRGGKKAVWLGPSKNFFGDGQNAWKLVTGQKKTMFQVNSTATHEPIKRKDGILFSTYSTLIGKSDKVPGKTRLKQIQDWLGEDFDGVIAFDEAHNMKNAIEIKGRRGNQKPSQQAVAGMALARAFPNARIVYASATGATDIINMAYLDRLNLWGPDTAFASKEAFVSAISDGGLAAMEIVARDMKAKGKYIRRQLSSRDLTYEQIEHKMDFNQTDIYNKVADMWRETFMALESVNRTNETPGNQLQAFWGKHQDFFNRILTSIAMPTLIPYIQAQKDAGNAVVLQITSTNQATLDRKMADRKEGETLEDVELSSKEILENFLREKFPVQAYQTVADENGNETQEMMTDEETGEPVLDREAVARRDELLAKLFDLEVPEGALDQIIQHFGDSQVAEVTSRKERVVVDDEGNRAVQKRPSSLSEVDAFMDDKKQILIFSRAGDTGASYHADNKRANKRKRIHILVEPGWQADRAIQGLGRTHRTDQAHKPHYVFAQTEVPGQRRFVASVIRKFDQVGALTGGERRTTSGGLLSPDDNIDNEYGERAVRRLIRAVGEGKRTLRVPGFDGGEEIEIGLQGIEMLLGKRMRNDDGRFTSTKIPDIRQFLNRVLGMRIDQQAVMYEYFEEELRGVIEQAIEDDEFDFGTEMIQHDGAEAVSEQSIYRDEETGTDTNLETIKMRETVKKQSIDRFRDSQALIRFVRTDRGRIWAEMKHRSRIDERGRTTEMVMRVGPTSERPMPRYESDGALREGRTTEMAKEVTSEVEEAWQQESDRSPGYEEKFVYLVTGALLPIWDRLPNPNNPKVYRIQLDDGTNRLGRVMEEENLPQIEQNFAIQLNEGAISQVDRQYTSVEDVMTAVVDNGLRLELTNRWVLRMSIIDRAERFEVEGPGHLDRETVEGMGITRIRQRSRNRFVIHFDGREAAAIQRLIERFPVVAEVRGRRRQGVGGGEPPPDTSTPPETPPETPETPPETPPAAQGGEPDATKLEMIDNAYRGTRAYRGSRIDEESGLLRDWTLNPRDMREPGMRLLELEKREVEVVPFTEQEPTPRERPTKRERGDAKRAATEGTIGKPQNKQEREEARIYDQQVHGLIEEITDPAVQVKTLGIYANLKAGKEFPIEGHKLSSAVEAAILMQVYRTPFAEKTWVFYLDDNDMILDYKGWTLNRTDMTTVGPISIIEADMERLGAKKFLRLHNHPSTVARFSDADKEQSQKWKDRFGERFIQDVIINSGTYAEVVYDSQNRPTYKEEIELPSERVGWDTTLQPLPTGIRPDDPLYKGAQPEAIRKFQETLPWGRGLTDEMSRLKFGELWRESGRARAAHQGGLAVAQVGRALKTEPNAITLMFVSPNGQIVAAREYYGLQDKPSDEIAEYIEEEAEKWGGDTVHVLVDKGDWYSTRAEAAERLRSLAGSERFAEGGIYQRDPSPYSHYRPGIASVWIDGRPMLKQAGGESVGAGRLQVSGFRRNAPYVQQIHPLFDEENMPEGSIAESDILRDVDTSKQVRREAVVKLPRQNIKTVGEGRRGTGRGLDAIRQTFISWFPVLAEKMGAWTPQLRQRFRQGKSEFMSGVGNLYKMGEPGRELYEALRGRVRVANYLTNMFRADFEPLMVEFDKFSKERHKAERGSIEDTRDAPSFTEGTSLKDVQGEMEERIWRFIEKNEQILNDAELNKIAVEWKDKWRDMVKTNIKLMISLQTSLEEQGQSLDIIDTKRQRKAWRPIMEEFGWSQSKKMFTTGRGKNIKYFTIDEALKQATKIWTPHIYEAEHWENRVEEAEARRAELDALPKDEVNIPGFQYVADRTDPDAEPIWIWQAGSNRRQFTERDKAIAYAKRQVNNSRRAAASQLEAIREGNAREGHLEMARETNDQFYTRRLGLLQTMQMRFADRMGELHVFGQYDPEQGNHGGSPFLREYLKNIREYAENPEELALREFTRPLLAHSKFKALKGFSVSKPYEALGKLRRWEMDTLIQSDSPTKSQREKAWDALERTGGIDPNRVFEDNDAITDEMKATLVKMGLIKQEIDGNFSMTNNTKIARILGEYFDTISLRENTAVRIVNGLVPKTSFDPVDMQGMDFWRTMNDATTILTLGPTASIQNIAEMPILTLMTGSKAMARGTKDFISDPDFQEAGKFLGTAIGTTREYLAEGGQHAFTWLGKIGFNKTDWLGRGAGTVAGTYRVQDDIRAYVENPNDIHRGRLEDVQVNVDVIDGYIEAGGTVERLDSIFEEFNERYKMGLVPVEGIRIQEGDVAVDEYTDILGDEIGKGAAFISDSAFKQYNALSLNSLLAQRDPHLRVFLKYQAWSYQQSSLIYRQTKQAFRRAAQGDFRSTMWLVTTMGSLVGTYTALRWVYDLLQDRDDKEVKDRLIDAFAGAQVAGYISVIMEIVRRAQGSTFSALNSIMFQLSPPLGTFLGRPAAEAMAEGPGAGVRQAIKQTPGVRELRRFGGRILPEDWR